jgi:thioredoxin reductase (NADPH)
MEKSYDVVIIGSGAAGLSAALYAGRYRMSVLVIGEEFGGETATAGTIWNYPGVRAADGYELMKTMKAQAKETGADFADGRVEKVEKEDGCFRVFWKNESVHANTVIFAIGTNRKHLNLPNEKELTGKGVHYCATCDSPLYGGKIITVVGGGDAAVKGINMAAEYASKIYVLLRGKEFRAEPANLEEMKALGDKVVVLPETQVKEIIGNTLLEKIILTKPYNGNSELTTDALFVEIGYEPNVGLATPLGVALDQHGFIATDTLMKTNIPGLYAAGDTTNIFGLFKQDVTAVATGAVAATSAFEYKKRFGNTCTINTSASTQAEA